MEYISGIVVQNAVATSLESCLPRLLAAAAADMAAETQALLQKADMQSPQQSDNNSTSGNLVSDHTRLCISMCAEELVDCTVTKVRQQLAQITARRFARTSLLHLHI